MQATDLLFPGIHGPAQQVRQLVASVLSQQESVSKFGDMSPEFANFLMDAASKSPGYVPPEVPETPAMPATKAIVEHQAFTQVLDYRGANAYQGIANLLVENNKLLATTIPANFTMLKTGARIQLNNAQYTFTIANGQITNIAVVNF